MKKKILLIAVLLWTGAVVFGETGYKGVEWGTKKDKVKILHPVPLPENANEIWNDIVMVEAPILGKLEKVSYIFLENTFYGVCYKMPREKTQELLGKYKNHVRTIKQGKLNDEIVDTLKKEFQSEFGEFDDENTTRAFKDFIIFSYAGVIETGARRSDFDIENGESLLHIYDYNDDTRVYIFENIYEGETVVVYVPHEQDY